MSRFVSEMAGSALRVQPRRGPCSSPRAPVILRRHGAQRCYVNTALPFIVQPQRPTLPTEGVRQPSIDGEGPGEDHGQLLRPAARRSCSWHRSIIPKKGPNTLAQRCETMRSVACIAMLLINAASLRPSQRRPRLQAPCAAAANRQAKQRDAAP